MPIHKRPFHFLLFAILLGGLSAYAISMYPPDFSITVHSVSIPLIPFVLAGILLTIFFFVSYLFHSMIQGVLITLFLATYVVLRFVGLKNIFFLFLLLALLGSLEVFFFKKK